jgi:hypothetical protein
MMQNEVVPTGSVSETQRVVPSSFEELIALRTELINTNKRNGCNFEDILVGLYKDPSHFILEILQNAEDAGASQISFDLTRDYLEIQYDGTPFSLDDVDSITTIGRSTKKDKPDQIGRFGIGFKSVFAVTITPVIESGKYHFQISDFMLPQVLGNSALHHSVRIKLPFNHPHADRNPDSVYNLIEEKLSSLGASCILFLSNLKEVRWKSVERAGNYTKHIYNEPYLGEYPITEVTSETGGGSSATKAYFLVFNRDVQVERIDRQVSIAFGFVPSDDGPITLGRFPTSPLHVFFPTSFDTGLPFLIQGPFRTVASREDIQINDPVNDYLLNELGFLLEETIGRLRDKGHLNLEILNLLPIEHSKTGNSIYNLLYKCITNILKDESGYIPNDDNEYSSPTALAIADKEDLVSVFDGALLSELMSKSAWVSRSIATSKYPKLREYLIVFIGIDNYNMGSMISAFDSAFLGKRSDAWLISFYKSLKSRPTLWIPANYNTKRGMLRSKPFIRLTNNRISEPFDAEENALVYLPRDGHTTYRTVKPDLIEDAEVAAFFKELGISEPNIFAEIREVILPRYNQQEEAISVETHLSDINLIQSAKAMDNKDEWNNLLKLMQRIPMVPVGYNGAGHLSFMVPSDTYVPTKEIKVYFGSNNEVNYVLTEIYAGIESASLHQYLNQIGCRFTPVKLPVNNGLPSEIRKQEQGKYGGRWPYDEEVIDFDLQGIATALSSPTKQMSVCIWNLLQKIISTSSSYSKGNCLKAKYSYKYSISNRSYSTDTAYYDSILLRQLKESSWMFTSSGELVQPGDITFEDLSTVYAVDKPEAEILITTLRFKLTEEKALEKKTGLKVVLMSDKDKEAWEKYLKSQSDGSRIEAIANLEDGRPAWVPEKAVDEVEIRLREAHSQSPVIAKESNLLNKLDSTAPNIQLFIGETKEGYVKKNLSQEDKNRIGEWGENIVYNYLKKKFSEQAIRETKSGFITEGSESEVEIKWLNQNGEVGIGCDFEIWKEGSLIEQIEVKSSKETDNILIELSRTQWETAKYLHLKNQGNQYSIYVVAGAGTDLSSVIELNDPLQKWYDNYLVTQNVQFRIQPTYP